MPGLTQWLQKPPLGTPIDWGNPITHKLAGAWLINEPSGDRIYNGVNNDYGLLQNSMSIGYGKNGTELHDLSISSNVLVSNKVNYSFTNNITIYCRMMRNVEDYSGIFSMGTINTSGIVSRIDPSGQVMCYIYDTGTRYLFTNNDFVNNIYNDVCILIKPVGGKIYLNGLDKTSAADNVGTITYGSEDFYIGASTHRLSGYMAFYYIWNRSITYNEIISLYINPYQIYHSPLPYYFGPKVSITGTLDGSLLRLSGDLDGVITITGTVSGELDRLSGSLTGIYGKTDIVLSGELNRLTGSFSGAVTVEAELAGALGRLTGDLSGVITVTGTLGGELDRLSGTLTGRYGSGSRGLYIEIGINL